MTTTDTGAALLKAIIANPDEDTPRLVYADYLQENGDDERAEFIRVQVALALLPLCGGGDVVSAGHCSTCRNVVEMRRHARELLGAHREKWLRVLCQKCGGSGFNSEIDWPASNGCMACNGTGDIGGLTESVHPATFARGFLDCVEGCRLADVFGRKMIPCAECQKLSRRRGPGGATQMRCGNCDGGVRYTDHQPTAWILRVFARHPTITRVPLADKRPEQVDIDRRSGWTWFVGDASFANSPIHVTNDLWHKMPSTWYATEAAANDTLARAVADVVRAASQQPQE